MTDQIRILGLLIRDRIKESGKTQKILTENAHLIKSRLGFHEVSEEICSRVGIIILQISGPREECDALERTLDAIGGVEIKKMQFAI
jgi:MOSC domain-containing protein YiiM